MVIFVSISAASLVQWWVRRHCSSSIASFDSEDRVCWNSGYDRMFGLRSNWFGCSLRPGKPLNSTWTLDSSALQVSFVVIGPTVRSNNGSCSRTNDWQLSTWLKISAFIPNDMKASLWLCKRDRRGDCSGLSEITDDVWQHPLSDGHRECIGKVQEMPGFVPTHLTPGSSWCQHHHVKRLLHAKSESSII